MSPEVRLLTSIALFKDPNGSVLAFHPQTLELAEVSAEVWSSLDNQMNQDVSKLATLELQNWVHENEMNALQIQKYQKTKTINSITLNVTQICNLQCVYCAAGGDGTYGNPQRKISVEKTLPQLKSLLEMNAPGSTFSITFLGGEPLLYPDGIELICEYASSMALELSLNLRFSIVTNGTLLNEKILALFKKYSLNITVSIDGPAEINDKVRPGKTSESSTKKTIENLNTLSALKSELGSLHLHGVFGEHSMEIEKAYDFYRQFNVDTYEFAFTVEKSNSELNQVYIQKMTSIASRAWTIGGESELRKINFFNKIFKAVDNTEVKWNYCGAGKNYLMIDVENNIYTCPWDIGEKAEMVGKGSQLNSEKLERYQNSLIELNNCQTCWARHLCGGGCMYINKQSNGDKHLKDNLYCQRTQNLIALALMYYKEARA